MSAPTLWLTTLGCSKNQVDSDKITAILGDSGYRDAVDLQSADVVMVNTCAFIEDARRESIDTILELAEAKRRDAKLVVIGCMAQRYERELIEALPEADAVIGLDRYPDIIDELDALTGWRPIEFPGFRRSRMDILDVVKRPTPSTPFAYVKVAEGCNKTCAFCAIPLIRGRQRSRPGDSVIAEIEGLIADGIQEIVLVAQDLAAYGRDNDAGSIEDLVERAASVGGLGRLRLYYLFPREIRQGLIDVMAGHRVIAEYFDLSLQHSSPSLLRSMRRSGSGEKHLALIERIRDAAPGAATRSSFIVGYPGETDEDVEGLAAFLEEARLDWAGFFPYSAEDGTDAATMPDQIPHDEITERMRHLQGLQDDISAAANARTVGRTLDILIDQVEDGQAVGRSYREAPEIDGVILLDSGAEGEWVTATIDGAYGIDLAATVVAP
ncbi:MAG: 30S ribosomal protein S12 methylthiotransferase RimO [Actinomycetota bacterium]|nr:30S ribosomal protein S12 methylthiotransferase RimO [Actinomycetota bacterium]MDK1015963.1 30S ribosomal protein S12 methylthiotransferase RimO [Actinomycetota bacterium]MDK1025980.1 30S ribosomal protein S12 methylthiotransferase RimO [Actinomycetota bacterium]MDK1038034.1 30S ribosomal protein S12 methylthiotransferase RimO [Actinomycetota bacterium]MDK1096508.1 30S ribosomal protein S12 methylthiotransferase RimO [Actinomycetota bacterium]